MVLTSATWWSGGQVVTPDLVPGVPALHYLPTSEREDCSQLDNPRHEERLDGWRLQAEAGAVGCNENINSSREYFSPGPSCTAALAVAAQNKHAKPLIIHNKMWRETWLVTVKV